MAAAPALEAELSSRAKEASKRGLSCRSEVSNLLLLRDTILGAQSSTSSYINL
jgi:hypothetical protein